MRVLYYAVGEEPEFRNIRNFLADMQQAVGGYIETLTLSNGAVIVCNEEARLLGLPHNRMICASPVRVEAIKGDFFVCEADVDKFKSITNRSAEFVKRVII